MVYFISIKKGARLERTTPDLNPYLMKTKSSLLQDLIYFNYLAIFEEIRNQIEKLKAKQ